MREDIFISICMHLFLNICEISHKELVSRIYQELLQNDKKKASFWFKKWAKNLNRHFIKKMIFKWIICTCKRSQYDYSTRKSKWKFNEILLHTRMAKMKRTYNAKCWQRCGVNGVFILRAVWNINCFNYFGKLVVSMNLNIHTPYNPEILLLGVCPTEINAHVYKKTSTRIFTTVLFIIAKKKEKNLSINKRKIRKLC